MKTTDKILIVDLEATCWPDEAYQRKHSEIIEIGICELDAESGEIEKKRGILIKPLKSEISTYCTELTTITPERVEQEGVSFEEAIDILFDEYDSSYYTWASYGDYDRRKMQQQCKEFRTDYPFGNQHIYVKEEFRFCARLRKAMGMKRALQYLNFPMEGTHHRGVDDAYNTAKILHWCLTNE